MAVEKKSLLKSRQAAKKALIATHSEAKRDSKPAPKVTKSIVGKVTALFKPKFYYN